jgi:hypothetical protein
MKFTKEQVLEGVRNYREKFEDSPVIDAWMDMAGNWLIEDSYEYLKDGFEGFNSRTEYCILLDFHYNGQIEPTLTPEEVKKFEEMA